MHWFGEDWGALICKQNPQAPTPDGAVCAHGCGHRIRPGDKGFLLPFAADETDAYEDKIAWITMGTVEIPHLVYHFACFMDEIGARGVTQ